MAKQIDLADQEIFDLPLFGDFGEIGSHGEVPLSG
jgi:hypothetical protein